MSEYQERIDEIFACAAELAPRAERFMRNAQQILSDAGILNPGIELGVFSENTTFTPYEITFGIPARVNYAARSKLISLIKADMQTSARDDFAQNIINCFDIVSERVDMHLGEQYFVLRFRFNLKKVLQNKELKIKSLQAMRLPGHAFLPAECPHINISNCELLAGSFKYYKFSMRKSNLRAVKVKAGANDIHPNTLTIMQRQASARRQSSMHDFFSSGSAEDSEGSLYFSSSPEDASSERRSRKRQHDLDCDENNDPNQSPVVSPKRTRV